ncbi:hypothetical protein ACOJUR_12430 [Alicyclobacillus tolerans]|uniref:hypothetical protein n=1 Tax=Alicyclobacillus tolerans TaxID=90970 RepID=UPI003B7A96D6
MSVALDTVQRCDVCRGHFRGQALTPAIGYDGVEYVCSACLKHYPECPSCGENVLGDLQFRYKDKSICQFCIEDAKQEAEERRDMQENADLYAYLDRLDEERKERRLWR